MAAARRYCVPGERLCSAAEAAAGSGTYTRRGAVCAALAGCMRRGGGDGGGPQVAVLRDAEAQLLPDVGAVVTCRVTGGHRGAPGGTGGQRSPLPADGAPAAVPPPPYPRVFVTL